MLSRTAANLYWIGRNMERAEFATRLIEATIRLAALGDHEESEQAWRSALSVVGAAQAFQATGEAFKDAVENGLVGVRQMSNADLEAQWLTQFGLPLDITDPQSNPYTTPLEERL